MLVLCYTHLLKLNGKQDQALRILEESIKTTPTGSYKRYFELADIYQGVQSIQTYELGIQEAIKCLQNPFKSTVPEE